MLVLRNEVNEKRTRHEIRDRLTCSPASCGDLTRALGPVYGWSLQGLMYQSGVNRVGIGAVLGEEGWISRD